MIIIIIVIIIVIIIIVIIIIIINPNLYIQQIKHAGQPVPLSLFK